MKLTVLFACLVWLSASAAGVGWLARYEATPASDEITYPQHYPAASSIARLGNRPTLIFFVHPKCPCTKASLHELERLMTDTNSGLDINIVFSIPENSPSDFSETDLRAEAEGIPGVSVLIDENRLETEIFHARTSGLVLVYDSRGELVFNGGITSARGHEGDNAGRTAITEIVRADRPTGASPVYGCPLHRKDCKGDEIHPQ